MAVRQTGWAMLAANSVQEAMDFALIAQAASLESRIPFVHFFDGFRTSHEIAKVEQLSTEDIQAMISGDLVRRHREAALSPEHPFIRAKRPIRFILPRQRSCRTPWTNLPRLPVANTNCLIMLARPTRNRFLYLWAPAQRSRKRRLITSTATEPNLGCSRFGFTGRFPLSTLCMPCLPREKPSPCWIAARSRAQWASRCIWTLSPRSVRLSRSQLTWC